MAKNEQPKTLESKTKEELINIILRKDDIDKQQREEINKLKEEFDMKKKMLNSLDKAHRKSLDKVRETKKKYNKSESERIIIQDNYNSLNREYKTINNHLNEAKKTIKFWKNIFIFMMMFNLGMIIAMFFVF